MSYSVFMNPTLPTLQLGATDGNTNGAVSLLLNAIRDNKSLWSQLQDWEKEDVQFNIDEPTDALDYDYFLQGIVIRLQNHVGLQGTGIVDESTWRAFGVDVDGHTGLEAMIKRLPLWAKLSIIGVAVSAVGYGLWWFNKK